MNLGANLERRLLLGGKIAGTLAIIGLLAYLLMTIPLGKPGGSGDFSLKISNRMDQAIVIHINHTEMGEISPNGEQTFNLRTAGPATATSTGTLTDGSGIYVVEAATISGTPVYTHFFRMSDLWDINFRLTISGSTQDLW